jgi:hypothetical protein
MDVDHVEPVMATEDSGKDKDWNKVVARMFCPESNLQNICWICHALKSKLESEERTAARKENKK